MHGGTWRKLVITGEWQMHIILLSGGSGKTNVRSSPQPTVSIVADNIAKIYPNRRINAEFLFDFFFASAARMRAAPGSKKTCKYLIFAANIALFIESANRPYSWW